jgi:hypothetical protein
LVHAGPSCGVGARRALVWCWRTQGPCKPAQVHILKHVVCILSSGCCTLALKSNKTHVCLPYIHMYIYLYIYIYIYTYTHIHIRTHDVCLNEIMCMHTISVTLGCIRTHKSIISNIHMHMLTYMHSTTLHTCTRGPMHTKHMHDSRELTPSTMTMFMPM